MRKKKLNMLAVWNYIEADFMRDYGIVLTEELPYMSWRRFKILLDGLSPHGTLAMHYDIELKKQREEQDKEKAKQGIVPASVQSFWNKVTNFKKPRND